MAKRINFPKPLFLHIECFELYERKFKSEIIINYFSNRNVLISENCERKNIAYILGELNGICVNNWHEEREQTHIFIISKIDYENYKKGIESKELNFIISLINKKQTLVDEKAKTLTSRITIICEEIFYDFFNDRKLFIQNNEVFSKTFKRESLFAIMKKDYCELY